MSIFAPSQNKRQIRKREHNQNYFAAFPAESRVSNTGFHNSRMDLCSRMGVRNLEKNRTIFEKNANAPFGRDVWPRSSWKRKIRHSSSPSLTGGSEKWKHFFFTGMNEGGICVIVHTKRGILPGVLFSSKWARPHINVGECICISSRKLRCSLVNVPNAHIKHSIQNE